MIAKVGSYEGVMFAVTVLLMSYFKFDWFVRGDFMDMCWILCT